MKGSITKIFFSIFTVAILVGCGGGGGNSGNSGNYSGGSGGGNSGNGSNGGTITHPQVEDTNGNCNFTLNSDINSTAYALGYLNKLRCLSGEHNFTMNNELKNAAQAHSYYMDEQNVMSHNESNQSSQYYTGYSPSDRANNASYSNYFVGENISAGQNNFQDSIDGLYSAIYHRFGFMKIEEDEIGIGKANKKYTFDMGLSTLSSINTYRQNAPKELIWPPNNVTNIPPAFFDEEPDPLPNYDVSGYPVSVLFNKGQVTVNSNDCDVTLNSFTIKDEQNNYLPTESLSKDNDSHLNGCEYVIFPKERLQWGSKYIVNLNYTDSGTTYTKQWCFSTRSLSQYANKVYKITDTSNSVSLDIINNTEYVIYVVPRDKNDIFTSYSANGQNVSALDSKFIDNNTLYIKVTGNIGGYVTLHLNNNRDITLNVSSSDSASSPKNQTCSL